MFIQRLDNDNGGRILISMSAELMGVPYGFVEPIDMPFDS